MVIDRCALLGAIHSAAQVISCELILGFSLVGIFINKEPSASKSCSASTKPAPALEISNWFILGQPRVILFMIAAVETNRVPFDLLRPNRNSSPFMTGTPPCALPYWRVHRHHRHQPLRFHALLGGTSGLVPASTGARHLLAGCQTIAIMFFIWIRATLPRFR